VNKNIFIDSNIWLDLYHFSSDDLNQFGKLKDMIGRDVRIFFNQQVADEVARNRTAKVKDAYNQFKSISIRVPNLCKGYQEYETFIEVKKTLERIHRELCNRINDDIAKESLRADVVMEEIVKLLDVCPIDACVPKARERYERGNPPGKNNSLGDAINWEFLLDRVPNGEPLFLVSADKDFRSTIDDLALDGFLEKEWKRTKGSDVFFYPSLSQFINRHLKDIELVSEQEKDELIGKLREAGSFARTHSIIRSLRSFSSYTDEQAQTLVDIAEDNSQVGGIVSDPDLYAFYRGVLSGRDDLVSQERHASLMRRLDLIEKDAESDDDWPF